MLLCYRRLKWITISGDGMEKRKTSSWHIFILLLLYLSQGLPFGFQVKALPVYLRGQGVSLTLIGFASALAAPWLFKALWAPLVDRYWSNRLGRRKSWIIPLQVILFLTIVSASLVDPSENLGLLMVLVFLMNLAAATQDIAVDGLAVDILGDRELGYGNAAQVVGYKIGMLLTGGLLVYLSGFLGWRGYFAVMALVSLLPLPAILLFREKTINMTGEESVESFRDIIAALLQFLKKNGALWVLLFIASYKIGEAMIDGMFKPFLLDNGIAPQQIGLWLGSWGMGASIAGSITGGLLASKLEMKTALTTALVCRLIPLGSIFWLSTSGVSAEKVIPVTIGEHFFGGMLTTVIFAFMMSMVDREIGATHYTILASIEVLGKSPGYWFSGILADAIGYQPLFAIGLLFAALVLLLVPLLPGKSPDEAGGGEVKAP